MEDHPEADLLVHPECGCSTACMYHATEGDIPAPTYIFSTEKMVQHAKASEKKNFLVATEIGILHRLKKEAPGKNFVPVSESAICEHMKKITVEKVLWSLEDMHYKVTIPEQIRIKAKTALDRMVEILPTK